MYSIEPPQDFSVFVPKINYLKAMRYMVFYGNLYECPWGQRLDTCPVNPVTDLTFEEKYKWFNNLDDNKKNEIFAHHNQCSKKRALKKLPETSSKS